MLQVLTNSSTAFGTSEICVSRSLQWMTFTPSSIASSLNVCDFASAAIFAALAPLTFFSATAAAAMSSRPRFVQCEIRPGFAPCSSTAVAPGVFHFASILRMFIRRQ